VRIFEVSEVMHHARGVLERDPLLADLWIHGEISSLSQSPAGHVYFGLRDAGSQLKCVMFRNAARRLTARLEPGQAVVAHGAIGLYEAQSLFQLYVDLVQPEGVGLAHLEFELLRQRLEDEGLFAPERKRQLPAFPRRIGVATSLSGAVIHDITRVLGRRFPMAELVVVGCAVQGEGAPREIVAALRCLNRFAAGQLAANKRALAIDVIVVARGGGAPEELAVFNDEGVARAIFASAIPVISAIGHETDYTIADLVADVRAATPSVAAELVAPDCASLRAVVQDQRRRLASATLRELHEHRRRVEEARQQIRWQSPQATLAARRQRVDDRVRRATSAMRGYLRGCRGRLDARRLQLLALSPETTLARGYALCYESVTGDVIVDAAQVGPGARIDVRLHRGELHGEVQCITELPSPPVHRGGQDNVDGQRSRAV
jgi:exodeoxyribonuclease VII large subunit